MTIARYVGVTTWGELLKITNHLTGSGVRTIVLINRNDVYDTS